jgi:predicted kinase
MLRAGLPQSFETGVAAYEVCGTIAERQLTLGFTVIADAANDLEIARDTWRRAASSARSSLRVIHVICSDADVHRRRLARRQRGLSHYPEPTWSDVTRRRLKTEPWPEEHLTVDSVEPPGENVRAGLRYVLG